MNPSRLRAAAWLMATVSVVAAVSAQQQNAPHAGYVYPGGGQRGTHVQVKVGGQFLEGATGVLVSGAGVQARVVEYDKPLTQRQITDLRDKLQELLKNGIDPAARKAAIELRDRIADSVRRNSAPVLSESVTLDVAIDSSAEPGMRTLRLATPLGLTNPLAFAVGELPEFREIDVKNSRADAELGITIPAVVNGRLVPGDIDRVRFPQRQAPQYMPGDVDRYRFMARKGQQLVAAVSARDLIPYLADAVPGWFQATLALYDPGGREIAYQDDYRFHPDPVLHCEIPADGEYVLEIRDALYRGREDFVYRIAIGELPVITSVFPLGGRTGSKTELGLSGWNLPSATTVVDARKGAGVYPVVVRQGGLTSNPMVYAASDYPSVLEREPNNSSKEAQRIKLPLVVDGRIQQAGDRDVVSFEGRAGESVVAEVTARRLESPMDSAIELTNAAGKRLAFNDDHDDRGFGLQTHQADSLITATLPAAGTYFLRVWDVQGKGGPEYAYRLRVSAPAPDFALWISPSTVNAMGGTTIPVTVYARRDDGFNGDIALSLVDPPGGYKLSGGLLPAGQDRVRVTLTVPAQPGPAAVVRPPLSLALQGRASIRGKDVVRRATPADDMMQAFAYRHLVPADDLRVALVARGGIRASLRVIGPERAALKPGGSVPVKIALPPGYRGFDKLQFELDDPPDGITIEDATIEADGATFVVRAEAAKAKAGSKGNLIVTVSGERVPPAAQQPAPPRRRVVLGTLPAIPFEISAGS